MSPLATELERLKNSIVATIDNLWSRPHQIDDSDTSVGLRYRFDLRRLADEIIQLEELEDAEKKEPAE